MWRGCPRSIVISVFLGQHEGPMSTINLAWFFFVTPRNKQPARDQSITIPISIRPASVPLPFRFRSASVPLPFRFRPVSVPLPSASVPLPFRFRSASVGTTPLPFRFRPASIPLPDRFPSASLLLPAPACPTFSGLPFAVEYINACSPEPFSSAQSFSAQNGNCRINAWLWNYTAISLFLRRCGGVVKATRSSVSSDELPEKVPNGRKKGASTVFFTFCVFQKKAEKNKKKWQKWS